jgi:hypothetical protein
MPQVKTVAMEDKIVLIQIPKATVPAAAHKMQVTQAQVHQPVQGKQAMQALRAATAVLAA